MDKYIMAYLFVHFREMWTEKGEQVYFALSKNGYDWENATYLEENTLGTTSREATIIHFPEPKDILMIRFIFNDQAQSSSNMGVVVSEISLF